MRAFGAQAEWRADVEKQIPFRNDKQKAATEILSEAQNDERAVVGRKVRAPEVRWSVWRFLRLRASRCAQDDRLFFCATAGAVSVRPRTGAR